MLIQMIPVILAAGAGGPVAGIFTGVISGLFFSVWETHSVFTLIEFGYLGAILSELIYQNYRPKFYGLIRKPISAVLIAAILFIPIKIVITFFSTATDFPARLDYSFTQIWPEVMARGISLLEAGLVVSILIAIRVFPWGREGEPVPAPIELSLQKRFVFSAIPFLLLMFVTLSIGDWYVAGQAAKAMLERRMSAAAQVAVESLPFFVEAGQSLMIDTLDSNLDVSIREDVQKALTKKLTNIPFFDTYILTDFSGNVLGISPPGEARLFPGELKALEFSRQGARIQTYTMPPKEAGRSAGVSFISIFVDANNQPRAALIGRTDLNTNPFTRPAIRAIESISDINGVGYILDENFTILYSSQQQESERVYDRYMGELPENKQMFEQKSSTGVNELIYYYQAKGRPWSVVFRVPAKAYQELALEIGGKLFLLLLLLSISAVILLRLGIGNMASSLTMLSKQAAGFAAGNLEDPITIEGMDEIGQLGEAFERMRENLKSRLEELNKLLNVSRAVAENLDVRRSAPAILAAALLPSATSARLAFTQAVGPEDTGKIPFLMQAGSDDYEYLDDDILSIMQEQSILVVPNFNRFKKFNVLTGKSRPGAFIALALNYENSFYGVLWVAFRQVHHFEEAETKFLSTLAGMAALAAATSRIYSSAEVGRQRLEAVVNSTPEPVLVIDNSDRLLIFNPAASDVIGLLYNAESGRLIKDTIPSKELLSLLLAPPSDLTTTGEISLENRSIYHVSVAPVHVEGNRVGKICVLRDITQFKKLDSLKSEFVATVSHDLRSPLTLMRGYASMLQLVGELNEQQKGYAQKIMAGVENMNRLVNDLLDLGKIETGIAVEPVNVKITDVIADVLDSVHPQAIQKKITIEEDYSGLQQDWLLCDKAMMNQALYNLVENAIKFSSMGGKVVICVSHKTDEIVFEIKDNGIGIAPIDLPRLFEKFYHGGRRESSISRGSGLGLSIVKSIAEKHRGRVWVDSQLGKGSSFYIAIPVITK
ncbi:MAG: HAMP domain-containing protein [Anaerolineaceae bacterium]|nr:HAMP domain-containing protein [Anaerolineaceae bacterium]